MPDDPDVNVKSSMQTSAHSILGTATAHLRGLLLAWDCSVLFKKAELSPRPELLSLGEHSE